MAPIQSPESADTVSRGRAGFVKRLDDISGNPKARRAWTSLAIVFFVIIILVPSMFVLTKVLSDWDLVDDVLLDGEAMGIIWNAMFNSFSIAFIVTIIDILVGLPMAWILVRRQFKGRKYLDAIMDIPLAFPTAVLGISVVIFWGAPEGIEIPGLGLVMSPYMMILLLHIIFTFPYMVRSLAAILEQIDPNYETAAMTLGASKWTAVRTITLPLFRTGLATGFILCFARSLSETGGTYIALAMMGVESVFFTGPTYIAYLKDVGGTEDAMGAMILISALMIIFALILLIVAKRLITKMRIPLKKVWPELGRKISRGALPKVKDTIAYLFLFIMVLLPSFYIFIYLTEPFPEMDMGGLFSSMGISFLIAGSAVAIDVIFGIPIAMKIARNKSSKLSHILDELVNVPLIIPTTALGFSLALFWGSFGELDSLSLLLVILGHVAFTYPLVVRNIVGALEEVDPAYEEVAMTLGAKPFQAFRKILLPMVKASVFAGGILAFTRSLGETGATIAISSDIDAIPVYITGLVKAGEYADAAIASILLIMICFVLIMIVRKLTGGDSDARDSPRGPLQELRRQRRRGPPVPDYP